MFLILSRINQENEYALPKLFVYGGQTKYKSLKRNFLSQFWHGMAFNIKIQYLSCNHTNQYEIMQFGR